MADFGSALWNKPASGGVSPSDPVTRSLRLADNSYLSFTPSTATTTRQKAVINFWFKLAEPESSSARNTLFFTAGTVQGSPTEWFGIKYDANTSKIEIGASFGSANGATTAAVFRDYSSWYNLHLIVDTTESSNSNKFKLYINGVLQTLTGTFPTLNSNLHIGSDKPHRFGWQTSSYHSTTFGPQVYIANAYLLENSTLPFTDFIEDTGFGSYKPKETSGLTFGTNGFHLKFEDSSDIGSDSTSNSNDFAATNLSSHDVMLDCPTSNYPVLNVLDKDAHHGLATEGNLLWKPTNSSGTVTYDDYAAAISATMQIPSTGKWYFEFRVSSAGTGHRGSISITNDQTALQGRFGPTGGWNTGGVPDNQVHVHVDAYSGGFVAVNARAGGTDNSTTHESIGSGNYIMSIAIDSGAKKLWARRDGGSWYSSGNPVDGTNPNATWSLDYSRILVETCTNTNTTASSVVRMNFGADPTFQGTYSTTPATSEFAFAPPTGFVSLNTSNLDAPSVTPADYFEIAQWVGDESTSKVISTDISPDLVWIKNRDVAKNHTVGDSVRGANKALFTNNTNTESTGVNNITAFDTDATGGYSFTLGASEKVNDSGKNHVGWVWKESASAGFDIVTYEGDSEDEGETQSISHSLGVTPEMIIVKARDGRAAGDYYAEDSWYVWHKDLTSGTSIFLNSTSAAASYSFSGAAPISSVGSSTFTVCNSVEDDNYYYDFLNWGDPYFSYTGENERYIAYLFSGVEGYSKFGTYEGNGSTDGPFIYTGFRPRWIMVKPIDDPYAWYMHDTARSPYNYSDRELVANTSGLDYSVSGAGAGERFDILSNGFKHRTSNLAMNANNKTMIYAAFAESPLKHANAR